MTEFFKSWDQVSRDTSPSDAPGSITLSDGLVNDALKLTSFSCQTWYGAIIFICLSFETNLGIICGCIVGSISMLHNQISLLTFVAWCAPDLLDHLPETTEDKCEPVACEHREQELGKESQGQRIFIDHEFSRL